MNPVALSSIATAALQNGGTAVGTTAQAAPETPFAGVLKQAFQQMQQLEADAAQKVDGLLRGTGVDVHAAMIAEERSDLAFETVLAVRGKAVSAYEQLSSMQF